MAMRAVIKQGARYSPLNPCLAPTMHKPNKIFTVRAVSTSPSALPIRVHTRVGWSNTRGRETKPIEIQDTPQIQENPEVEENKVCMIFTTFF